MTTQTIEQAVEETSRHFCNGIALQLEPSNEVMKAIRLLNKELPKALQAQRDAGAGAEKKRIYQEYIVLRKETKKERDLSNAWNDLGNTLRNGV